MQSDIDDGAQLRARSNLWKKHVMSSFVWLRKVIGVVLKELNFYLRAFGSDGNIYLALHNRDERLEVAPNGLGFRCLWQWTSDLHAPKYLPSLGLRLMKRALADHPVIFKAVQEKISGKPDIGFIIGHRGLDRLPHLLVTLESIAGQSGVAVECLVVEQDTMSRIADRLPSWVCHVLTPPPEPDMPYCRSWTFNVGVKMAVADVLVLHDNDMPIPADYSSCILEKVSEDYEVVNLKRFIFYLSEQHTAEVFSDKNALLKRPPQSIMQNSEGGGSIAITRKCYEEIGGFDESFIGWGGEDNEFWGRAITRRLWPYAFLPVVHLWHAAQVGKHDDNYDTAIHYRALSKIAPQERIRVLQSMPRGRMEGPSGKQVD